MNEIIGYVHGNKQRERVIQVLGSKGPMAADKIAKVERIPPAGARKVMQELADKGLITQDGDVWKLTDLGVDVEKEMKRRA